MKMSFLVLILVLINILSAFCLVIPNNNNVKRDLVKRGINLSAEILLFCGAGALVIFVIIVLCCCRMIRGNPDDDDEPIENKETIKITKTKSHDSDKLQTNDNSNSTLNVSESNINNNNENDISQISLNYTNDSNNQISMQNLSYNNLNNSMGYNNYNPNQMSLNRPMNMPVNMPMNMPMSMPMPTNNNQPFGYSNNQYSGNISMNNNNPSLGRQNNFVNNSSLGRQNNFNNMNNSQSSMNFMNINNQTGFGPSNQPNLNNAQNSVQNISDVSIDEMQSSLGRNDNAGHSTIPRIGSDEKHSSGHINAPKIEEDPLPRYQTINLDKKHSESPINSKNTDKNSLPNYQNQSSSEGQPSLGRSNNYISERAKRTGKAPMQDSPKSEKGKFVPSHSIMVKNFALKPIKLN